MPPSNVCLLVVYARNGSKHRTIWSRRMLFAAVIGIRGWTRIRWSHLNRLLIAYYIYRIVSGIPSINSEKCPIRRLPTKRLHETECGRRARLAMGGFRFRFPLISVDFPHISHSIWLVWQRHELHVSMASIRPNVCANTFDQMSVKLFRWWPMIFMKWFCVWTLPTERNWI